MRIDEDTQEMRRCVVAWTSRSEKNEREKLRAWERAKKESHSIGKGKQLSFS
jgi:hypothetical protein